MSSMILISGIHNPNDYICKNLKLVMTAVIIIFVIHWYASLFFQTFFITDMHHMQCLRCQELGKKSFTF